MNASQTVGMVAVCIVAAFLVIIAVGPAIDKLQDPKLVTESNEPDYRLSSVEGYEGSIELADVELAGVPWASYEITEDGKTRTVTLEGYDALLWAFDGGYVLLTSAGIRTPGGALSSSVGDGATMAAGTVTAGTYTASYTDMTVPAASGTLGHYSGNFSITGGGTMQVYNLYGIGDGTASGVSGWTLDATRGDGNYLVTSAEDADGRPALGFVAPVEYVAVSQGSEFAALMLDVVPLVLLIILFVYAGSAVGRWGE